MSDMKRILTVAIVLMAMLTGCKENAERLPHLKPDRQAGLLPLFESLPIQRSDVVVLVGDDLIADGLWSEIFPELTIANRGIPGDCVADIIPRALEIAASAHPHKLFISAGRNDFERVALEAPEGHGRLDYEPTVQRVALEIQKLFRNLHRISPETELYWLSMYGIPAMDADAYPAMRRVNGAVEAYAAKTGYYTCIDLDKALSQGIEEGELSFTEGRWLNGFGYARVAGFIATRLCASNGMHAEIPEFTEAQYENVRNWYGSRGPCDGSRVSGYYLDRLSQFMALPRGRGGVVLFGDSLIDFGLWEDVFPGGNVHPRGIAGDQLAGFTARVEEVASQNPSVVVLLGGCNNLVKSPETAPEKVWKEYETLLSSIRKGMPEVELIVVSILPLNPKDAEEYEGFNARAIAVNAQLASVKNQKKYNYRYIDLAARFCDESGDLSDEFTTDGCHLTPAAYQVWVDLMQEALNEKDKRK